MSADVESAINHVVLLPKLPDRIENSTILENIELDLVARLAKATRLMVQHSEPVCPISHSY